MKMVTAGYEYTCRIARALGAPEAWYVEELFADKLCYPSFPFNEWVESYRRGEYQYVVELTTDILKGNTFYSVYHDDFSDVIMENPEASEEDPEL